MTMMNYTLGVSRRMEDDLIGETPVCTPIPQASSTAAHRSSDSPLPDEKMESEAVKTDVHLGEAIGGLKSISEMLQERNETDSDTNSSLGILEMDDLQGLCEDGECDVLNVDQELSDLAVDMRLRLQKELAQRALDRFSLASNKDDIPTVAKLGQGDSDKGSYLESFHSPFDSVNLDSETVANMVAVMVEFSGGEFIPGEQCEDKLLADESAWKKENIPPTMGPINPAAANLDFSGIVGNAEISVASTSPFKRQQKRKVSVGEFFRLKSNLSSSFGLQGKDKQKNCNLGTLTEMESDGSNVALPELETECSYSSDRISSSTRDSLSLSCIAKILSNVDTCASPRTVVSNILKQSGLCKSGFPKDESIPYTTLSTSVSERILKDSSNSRILLTDSYSNVPLITTRSRNKTVSSSDASSSKSRSNLTCGSSSKMSDSIVTRQEFDDSEVKREDSIASGEKVDESIWNVIQELSDVDCSALKEKCPWMLSQDGDQRNSRIEDNSSLDWIKMKYSTSLLSEQLSESSVCKLSPAEQLDLWISVGMPSQESHMCLGVPQDISLPIHNVTEHWILCGVELLSLQVAGQETTDADQIALIQLPSKKVLMDPNNCKEAKMKILPLCEGKLEICVKIQLSDVVTKSEQSVSCTIVAFAEEPQIVITEGADLDFGTLPEECAKVLTVTVANHGSSCVPLRLRALNEGTAKLSSFVLMNVDGNIVKELSFSLKPAESMTIQVMFAAPPLRLLTGKQGFVQLHGAVCVELDAVIPVELENISLIGRIGTTSLEVYQPAVPVKLVVNEIGKTVTSLLPLKNLGLVPVTVTPVMLPVDVDGAVLSVAPSEVEVKPGVQVDLTVSLTATKSWTQSLTSALQVTRQPLGPKFYVDVIAEFINKKEDKVRMKLEEAKIITPRSTKLASGNEHGRSNKKVVSGHSSRSKSSLGEKLNVRTTHRELVWGTVDVGKHVTKIFDVRSEEHFNIPAHVYIEDQQNAFKLLDGDGNAVTQRSVTLRPMKNYTFSVAFSPQKIGPVSAKLIFVIRELRLILPLYGYGGHVRLIAKGVPKDGGGRMWLMMYQHPHKTEWESSFCLRNLGNIRAFVKIKPISKGFQNVTIQNIVIVPSQLIILEGGTAKIKVKYEPQHKDLKLLMTNSVQDVVELAALSLVSGDEATRLRLKRIHKKQQISSESGAPPPALHLAPLCEKFTGEEVLGSPDVTVLKDPKESALDLYSCGVNHQEIILMLENVIDSQGVDASRAFQSMYHNVVDLSVTKFDETGVSDKAGIEWDIVPSSITLQPPRLLSACVQLWSTRLNKLSYEASVMNEPPGFTLVVTPNAGFIPSFGGICLTVTCTPTAHTVTHKMWRGIIRICTENDMKQLNVCVEYAPALQKKRSSYVACQDARNQQL